jgi:NADPH:quinone reductase-like Zn-dependent oxidoreductase
VTLGGWDRRILAAIVLGALLSRIGDKWSGLMLWWKPFNPDDVATLTSLVAEGRVKPAIDRRFPLDEIVGALRWVNDGHAMGKVIVTI